MLGHEMKQYCDRIPVKYMIAAKDGEANNDALVSVWRQTGRVTNVACRLANS